MDIDTINRTMSNRGFINNPAFQDLKFLIEDIPCEDSCPLGLYFPDNRTIVVPPGGEEGTILHELGHAHGDYYHNNLSEKYAENFRQKYQKGNALLYVGSDFERLPKFGVLYEEGERGAVEIALNQPLAVAYDGLSGVMNHINAIGYDLFHCECINCGYVMDTLKHCSTIPCPRCGGQMRRLERPGPGQPRMCCGNSDIPWVRYEFTKSADWLVVLGAALTATVLAGIGAITYAIYKTAKTSSWVIPVVLLGAGAFFLLRAASKQATVVAR